MVNTDGRDKIIAENRLNSGCHCGRDAKKILY